MENNVDDKFNMKFHKCIKSIGSTLQDPANTNNMEYVGIDSGSNDNMKRGNNGKENTKA